MHIVASVERSGFVESTHRGTVLHVAQDGSVLRAWGDQDVAVFPRSVNKPIQALAMLRVGLQLEPRLLALAMASHSGERIHLAAVDDILRLAGVDRSALQTPASYPVDPVEHAEVLRSGGSAAPIYMDCSGKHAAMLLTCVHNGWPIANYLDSAHPLQRQIFQTFAELTAGPPEPVGIDGCGAPLLGTTLRRLAHAVGTIARGEAGAESVELASAWLDYPQFVSGSRREEMQLMRAMPGLRVKSGAESVYVAVLEDSSVIAVKIEDGSERPLQVVMRRALAYAGCQSPLLTEEPTVLGGGVPVGAVRAVF